MKKLILLLTLAGCAPLVQIPPPAPQLVDTACAWDKLIVVPKADVKALSDDLAGQILAHDREWKKQCGPK